MRGLQRRIERLEAERGKTMEPWTIERWIVSPDHSAYCFEDPSRTGISVQTADGTGWEIIEHEGD